MHVHDTGKASPGRKEGKPPAYAKIASGMKERDYRWNKRIYGLKGQGFFLLLFFLLFLSFLFLFFSCALFAHHLFCFFIFFPLYSVFPFLNLFSLFSPPPPFFYIIVQCTFFFFF